MNDRPKRERKPTTYFEYRDTSGDSIIANAGGNSSKRKLATEAQNRIKIKKEDTESPNKGSSRGRGGRRGRSGGRSNRGKAGFRSSSRSRSHRYSLDPDTEEQPDDVLTALSSGPIDEGTLLDDNKDPDFETIGTSAVRTPAKRAQRSLKPPAGRKPLVKNNIVSRLPTDGDEVIEQWYADPYERVNPNNVAYDQWRLQNLQNSLQNQGYSIVNSKQMAAWLMKCNGHFMEFNAPAKKSRAKNSRHIIPGSDDKRSTVVSDMDVHQNDKDEGYGASDHVMEDSEQSLKQSEANAAFAAFKTAISSRRRESECTIQGSHTSTEDKDEGVISDTLSTTTYTKTIGDATTVSKDAAGQEQDDDEDMEDTHPKKTPKLPDKYELENLKRCLNVFNAVYGPQGPQSNAAKFELNHFSRTSALPALKPKAGLRTQAHYALQEVLLPADNLAFFNGIKDVSHHDQEISISQDDPTRKFRKVFTEDPDFGLTVVPESQRATEADMKLYYAQFTRDKLPSRYKFNSISDKDLDPDLDEENMTKQERHALLKSRNLESAQLLSEQLSQRLFDWETPTTMLGNAPPKQSKDDGMRPGMFALQERHVWKEVRRRQEILDEGGQEAARLLEQEWEDEQVEIRREERRRQNAAGKARKLARWEEEKAAGGLGMGEMNGRLNGSGKGRRKRVKFSGLVDEE